MLKGKNYKGQEKNKEEEEIINKNKNKKMEKFEITNMMTNCQKYCIKMDYSCLYAMLIK